jgi:hypothetical protein
MTPGNFIYLGKHDLNITLLSGRHACCPFIQPKSLIDTLL